MTSRKPTFMAGLSPVPSVSGRGNIAMLMKQKQQQQQQQAGTVAALSKEYLQAVQTLNESNMTRACELLLSSVHECDEGTSNGEGDNAETKSDDAQQVQSISQQLRDMYFQAEESMQVIRTQQSQTPNLLPGAPSLSGPPGRILPRTAGVVSNPLLKNKPTSLAQLAKPVAGHSLKSGVFPIRRTGKPIHMHHHHHNSSQGHHPHPQQQQQQQHTHHKRTLSESKGVAPLASKKQRISPALSGATASTTPHVESSPTSAGGGVAPPPPSALSFLAKLNKKTNGSDPAASEPPPPEKEEEDEKDENENERKDEEKETTEGGEEKDDDSSSQQRLRRRKNPPRGSHPNRK
ncbi:hypothetical protein IV203_014931 [Nitzschia inconspicua]|uniref:Uncharacterized protein n=1 Tax=Nitzschia inconspicua TaxID=303405 RepID=A0A9K3LA93_9STRA|nr:hypothetical protein IV203_014931 [Nitzschia inconspicua]